MNVAPVKFRGSCPVKVHFTATLYHGESHARFQYHWERGNGKMTSPQPGETLNGKVNITDEFEVGEPGRSFVATDRLHLRMEGFKEEIVSPEGKSIGTCTQ